MQMTLTPTSNRATTTITDDESVSGVYPRAYSYSSSASSTVALGGRCVTSPVGAGAAWEPVGAGAESAGTG